MAGKPKDFETDDDLRESSAHLDQVSARVSRLLADLAASKPTSADKPDQPPAEV